MVLDMVYISILGNVLYCLVQDQRDPLSLSIAQDDQMRFRTILKESPVHIAPENAAQKSQRETSRKYGSKLLGTPIGSDDYVNKWMDNNFLVLERELESY
jgi:hypothetical protein